MWNNIQKPLISTYRYVRCMLYCNYLHYNNFYIEDSVPLTDRQAQLIKIAHRKHRLKSSFCEEYVVIGFKKKNEKKCVLHCDLIFYSHLLYVLFKRERKRKWRYFFHWYQFFLRLSIRANLVIDLFYNVTTKQKSLFF